MIYSKDLADKLKKALNDSEIKIESDKEWEFDVIATTETKDRDGEVIKLNGWDTTNWEKNPAILINHSYKIEDMIGKGYKFYTSNGVKRLKGVFSKTNPKAILAKNLYQEGILKAVSVGFIIKERDVNDRSVITKAELLEVSFVPVPSNSETLSLDKKTIKDAIKKGLMVDNKAKEIVNKENDLTGQDTEVSDKIDLMKKDISEIKIMLKTLTDGKVKEQDIDEAKAKKDILQAINRGTALALENLKKL